MTRKEYIEAVKVKIEEISPFDEPESFIAADDPSVYTVQPMVSYIDESLNEAGRNCLRSLPLSLLHADIERSNPTVAIDAKGVGTFAISPNRRFVRFRHSSALERDITAFITSEDPMYLIMQDKDVRPGQCKTAAVVSSDMGQMEIYSYGADKYNTTATDAYLLSIDLNKVPGAATDYDPQLTSAQAQAQLIQSPIDEFIILECAAMVYDILKDTNSAQIMRDIKEAKIQATLQ